MSPKQTNRAKKLLNEILCSSSVRNAGPPERVVAAQERRLRKREGLFVARRKWPTKEDIPDKAKRMAVRKQLRKMGVKA